MGGWRQGIAVFWGLCPFLIDHFPGENKNLHYYGSGFYKKPSVTEKERPPTNKLHPYTLPTQLSYDHPSLLESQNLSDSASSINPALGCVIFNNADEADDEEVEIEKEGTIEIEIPPPSCRAITPPVFFFFSFFFLKKKRKR